ncbi:MAG: aminotransferase class V-fold PLP-dependent enzyme [Eubacteriales bacterium]
MIYLDSAATSLQKPQSVIRATSYALNHCASPGRGGHLPAHRGAEVIYACREACANLFHLENPEQVVFTQNATHAINIALKTLVKEGSTVLISGWEHNAVTRPLHNVKDITIKVAYAPLFDQEATVRAFERNLTSEVEAVVFTHVSNVFGFVLPIERLSALCRRRGVPFLIDASQSAGCLEINQSCLGANFIAMPGHKSLLGPQGTGILLCGQSQHITPILQGGTGSTSRCQTMPTDLPDRLEAGTHNVAGIAGLLQGIRYLERRGISSIYSHESALLTRMARGLSPHCEIYYAGDSAHQAGVLSFQMEGYDCEEISALLGEQGFALRAGLHCAPLAHQTAGTLERGTIRASVSPFNTRQEIDTFIRAVTRLAKNKK